jgi:tetratricopeptide (TPR) repeat protein
MPNRWLLWLAPLSLFLILSFADLTAWGDAFTQGVTAYKRGAYGEALKLFQSSVQTAPEDPKRLFYLGLAQAQIGKLAEARATFEKVGQLLDRSGNPDPALGKKVRSNIAVITQAQMAAQGNTDKAEQLRRATTASPQGHYLSYAIPNGQVIHWDPKRMPLRVYIYDGNNVPGWRPEMKGLVTEAMRAWQAATNSKVRFSQTTTPDKADIVVRWTQALSHNKVGENPFEWRGQTIVRSDLTIATHAPGGAMAMPWDEMRRTVLHELGHAIGVQGHSPYPEDIMYFSVNPRQSNVLTSRDRATINKLYALEADIKNNTAMSTAQTKKYYDLMQTAVKSHMKNDPRTAIQTYQQAIRLNPNDPDLYVNLGAALQDAGDLPNAIASYRRALGFQPNRWDAKYLLGGALVNQGVGLARASQVDVARQHFQEAVNHLQDVLRSPQAPPDTRAHLDIAMKNLQLASQ